MLQLRFKIQMPRIVAKLIEDIMTIRTASKPKVKSVHLLEDELFPVIGKYVHPKISNTFVDDINGDLIILFRTRNGDGCVLVSEDSRFVVGDQVCLGLKEFKKYNKPVTIENI